MAVQRRLISQSILLQVVAGASALHAVFDQLREIHADALLFSRSRLSGLQHLVHRFHQAIGVLKHQLVKLMLLGFIDLPSLQGLQVEANRRNRRLQFMSDGIDKAIVLLITPNLANQETGV